MRTVRQIPRAIADLIFGYDFFISYAHADGHEYPRLLRERLEDLPARYRVFYDKTGFVAGGSLTFETRRRIRMSTHLILLARPAALNTSHWVGKEVELFSKLDRNMFTVEFGDLISGLSPSRPIAAFLQDPITIRETPGANSPSESVIADLNRSFEGVRQETRRVRFLALAALFFLLLASFAGWQWYEAESRQRISEAMRLDALVGQHYAVANRILAEWDSEWARQIEIENDLSLIKARVGISIARPQPALAPPEVDVLAPNSTSDSGSLPVLTETQALQRENNLRQEIFGIGQLRRALLEQALAERANGAKLRIEADIAWQRAQAYNSSALTSRQPVASPDVFSIEVLSVGFGESLILHYGDPAAPRLILIDGGQPRSYAQSLRPRLSALKRAVSPDLPLGLQYVIVSNQDNDRLGGVLWLLRELAEQATAEPLQLEIANLWYGSFGPGFEGWQKAEARLLVERLGIPINAPFSRIVMRPRNGTVTVDMGNGLMATVLSPTIEEVTDLYDHWVEQAERSSHELLVAPADTFEGVSGVQIDDSLALPERPANCLDGSIPNRASHVLLFSYRDRTFLHGGDACGSQIEYGLRAAGLLSEEHPTFTVDVMLVPHQGSDRNVSPEFFSAVKAKTYLFTGDGTFGNPESETLRMILEARKGEDYTFQFIARDGADGFGERLDAFFENWPAAEYGYKRVFRSSTRAAMTVDLLERVRY
ncbi:TIR domain-containing protein [Devosia insulae]|uniref:TIR domain-containing protein n=1 Tax=Devosia insulae TaxID=408174 RepID=UPI00159F1D1A|nr:TIR domain-containing protein [Devosia insulae]